MVFCSIAPTSFADGYYSIITQKTTICVNHFYEGLKSHVDARFYFLYKINTYQNL